MLTYKSTSRPFIMLILTSLVAFASADLQAGKPFGPAGLGANLHRRFKVRHGLQKNAASYRFGFSRSGHGIGVSIGSRHHRSQLHLYSNPVSPQSGFRYVAPHSGYCNPYAQPSVPIDGQLNSESPRETSAPQPRVEQAVEIATAAFRNGDYRAAELSLQSAIEQLPETNGNLLQFQALIQFAQGDYHASAATIHAALRDGGNWDWAMIRPLYSTADVYTAQLRACEAASRREPNAPHLRFLLGYHYLACGHAESADRQFRQAVELEPRDELTRQLIDTLAQAD